MIDYKMKLSNILKEVLSEEYPKEFSMEQFNSINSYRGKIKYVQSLLPRISSGSSRIVYKIDDEKVLKLAKNKKGLAQNEVEGTPDWYRDSMELFAKVFDVDDKNYFWIEMELAKKVSRSQFKKLTGFTIEEISDLMFYCYSRSNQGHQTKLKDPELEKRAYEEDSFYMKLEEFIGNYDVNPLDFGKLNSYGEVVRNGVPTIVIIDYGLSNDVWKNHYKRK